MIKSGAQFTLHLFNQDNNPIAVNIEKVVWTQFTYTHFFGLINIHITNSLGLIDI